MAFVLLVADGGDPGRQAQGALHFIFLGVVGALGVDVVLTFPLKQIRVGDLLQIHILTGMVREALAFVEDGLGGLEFRFRHYLLRRVDCGGEGAQCRVFQNAS